MITQRETLVPWAFERTERGVAHLQAAADYLKGKEVGAHRAHRFIDSDLYKVMEGAAYLLQLERDPGLEARMDKIIAVIGIVGGIAVLSLLGTLIYARLNPPETKPPSWGNLQLSNLKHDLFERKDRPWIVKIEVHVNNASQRAKFRNVNIKAQILNHDGQAKCENYAPCGLYLSRKEIANVTRRRYHKALKIKAKGQAYNVQLNPGQGERCQVLLFCGKRYKIGRDKIKVAIDRKRTTRLTD